MTNHNAILVELFRHNVWANDEMLAACRDLTAEQLETDVPGTYGRLSQTLVHLARSQGGYLRHLTEWQPGPEQQLEYDQPFPGVDRLADHLRFTGEHLISVAQELAPDRVLELEEDGETERIAAWVVLLQAAYHATEHRQQVATALTNIGIQPPEPDLWSYWEEIRSPQ
ncbi:MAG: hypothetical protein DLM71_04030 [Chloroflexi bacterium]|nr:MAG: hypothetical protein DLM71_04030 [Chloroflexota bacterium]